MFSLVGFFFPFFPLIMSVGTGQALSLPDCSGVESNPSYTDEAGAAVYLGSPLPPFSSDSESWIDRYYGHQGEASSSRGAIQPHAAPQNMGGKGCSDPGRGGEDDNTFLFRIEEWYQNPENRMPSPGEAREVGSPLSSIPNGTMSPPVPVELKELLSKKISSFCKRDKIKFELDLSQADPAALAEEYCKEHCPYAGEDPAKLTTLLFFFLIWIAMIPLS